MRLIELFSLLRPVRGDGPLTREVKGVAWDCRRVLPGNLFVAIPGAGRDTQAAVDAAVERGATAVICEGKEVVGLRATRIQVASVRAVLPRIAELFFGQPDRQLKIVGVVGSSGASTAGLLLKSVLDASGFKCGLIGSSGCEAGERWMPALKKNAEALDYFEVLAQMVPAGCGACVIEISPELLEQDRFSHIAFDSVIFHRFNDDANFNRSAALRQFCASLAIGAKRCTGVFNLDDDSAATLFRARMLREQLSFGFEEGAEVRGSKLELAHGSLGVLVQAGSTEVRLRTKLTGRKNALNLLAACAGGLAMKAPLTLMRFTFQRTTPPDGELRPIGTAAELAIYTDGARSEAQVAEALENLREITSGRVLLVTGSVCGESADQRLRLGKAAARLADYSVITADNPGRERADVIASQIERGFEGRHDRYHVQFDRGQAIHDIIALAQPGDAVLIAGKGVETHQEFADTIVPFVDAEYAEAALQSRPIAPAPTKIVIPDFVPAPRELAAVV